MGVQVLRQKNPHFAARRKGRENRENEVKLHPPPYVPPPVKHSMN